MLLPLLLALAPAPAVCTPDGDPCASQAESCEVQQAYWHNDCGRHTRAADAFAQLYTKDPRPAFLYNAANASRLAGDCWTALAFYQRFLALGPPEDEAVLATKNVERCQAQIEAARGRAANVPPPRVDEPPPVDRDEPTPPRHWSRDPAGATLVGVGLGLVAVGVGVLAGAGWHDARAERATNDEAFGDHVHKRTSLVGVGAPIAAAGGGLVLSGIIRWAVLARDAKKKR
jgi:hypothetical protein